MEIKTNLTKLSEGDKYIAGPDEYVITDDHSHADLLRFMIADIGIEDVQCLLDMEKAVN